MSYFSCVIRLSSRSSFNHALFSPTVFGESMHAFLWHIEWLQWQSSLHVPQFSSGSHAPFPQLVISKVLARLNGPSPIMFCPVTSIVQMPVSGSFTAQVYDSFPDGIFWHVPVFPSGLRTFVILNSSADWKAVIVRTNGVFDSVTFM